MASTMEDVIPLESEEGRFKSMYYCSRAELYLLAVKKRKKNSQKSFAGVFLLLMKRTRRKVGKRPETNFPAEIYFSVNHALKFR